MDPMTQSLTPPERETVIIMDDELETCDVTTYQRRIYTKLTNNPAFELIEDLTWGTTIGGRFRGPASMISFRSRARQTTLTPERQAQAREQLAKIRASRSRPSKSTQTTAGH
jgi:hypothetical protein